MALTITNQLIVQAAQDRGWTHEVLLDGDKGLVMLYPTDDEPILLRMSHTELSTAVGNFIADDKTATSALARFIGVPMPEEMEYKDLQGAEDFLAEHKKIVIKPTDGAHGNGVTVGITQSEKIEAAVTLAHQYGSDVVLQKYYDGIDYRVLTIGGRFVAAAFRKPAFVIGDGKHTIRELIDQKNSNPLRGEGHESPLTKINHDEVAAFIGAERMEEVLDLDQELELLGTANLSRGGEAMDVTDQIHPEIQFMAEKISKAAGLGVCGVDIRCLDISLPPEESKPVLIEINVRPGLRMHHYPSTGTPRDVASLILDEIIKQRS